MDGYMTTGNELLDKVDKIKKWCTTNNVFYLKCDMLIPEEVEQEVKAIYDKKLFVEHRMTDGRGWKSCTLHGDEWNVTEYSEDKSKYRWTSLVEHAPVMTDWLKHQFPNNGHYSRCRFMLLESGGFIRDHTDTHRWVPGMPLKDDILSAINICITQPDNCYLRRTSDMKEVPFKPREIYWFNNGCYHEAANFSKQPRFHFIIHGGVNEERLELFVRSFEKEHPDAVI